MIRFVTEYLDKTVKKFGDKSAFVDENGFITFKDLEQAAKAIASCLIYKRVKEAPIVVFLPKGKECICAFLGAAYSRNFYCPIDIDMPIERVSKILNTLNPKVIITLDKYKNYFDNYNIEVVLYNEVIKSNICNKEIDRIKNEMIDTDPLYVLFTSGSTGEPKGVIISHQSVIDYIEWVTDTFGITENDSFANQAPFYFDNSILDIYTGLKTGATVHIISKKLFIFPIMLLDYLDKNKITTIFWVPSALCSVVNLKALTKIVPSSLEKVLFCGEVMPNKQLNVWRKYLPNALYANLYGPTEITDVCTYYIVNREFKDDESLPIGNACRNTEILILDENDKLVNGLGQGELCVKGRSLALGYYNNYEKTKEVFVQNPLNPYYRDLIYRTGDIVKYNEYGEIEYIGRKDFQIKHMGHRIELGEIEKATMIIEDIQSCVCVYDDKRKNIVMFYIGNIDSKDIIKNLKDKLPEYMIPTKLIKKDKFLLNANGKIDRVELKREL